MAKFWSVLLLWVSIELCHSFTPSTTNVRRKSSQLEATALIVQNKGGGHGELGFQVAQLLSKDNHYVTILQDRAANFDKEPFTSYESDLANCKIVKADLSSDLSREDLNQLLGFAVSFDYVFDNFSKGPEGTAKACADLAASSWKVQLYIYVSSAGVYVPNDIFPMPETTPVKQGAGQVQFEAYCSEQKKLPFVSFRPQYIYGPKSNKFDYIDYFFDRLVRNLPVPIPGDGTQLVSLTHSQDVASLLCAPLSQPQAAVEQGIFNCGTSQLISYNDLVAACAKVAEKEDTYRVEHYDGEALGKGNFPFRLTNFYVAPDTAMDKLGWSGPSHNLKEDLADYYQDYVARGGPTKDVKGLDLDKDWEIVVGSKPEGPERMDSVYSKYGNFEMQV